MKEGETDQLIAWMQRHMALVAGAGVILAGWLFLRLKKPAPAAEPAATATDQAPHTVYNDTYNTYQSLGATPTPNPTPAPTPSPAPGGVPTLQNPVVISPVSGRQVHTPGVDPNRQRGTTPISPPPHHSVTVRPWPDQDSTLSGIATHYHVSGGWMPIYQLDKSTIDAEAHQHGHYGDEYNWLFPGEVLALPN